MLKLKYVIPKVINDVNESEEMPSQNFQKSHGNQQYSKVRRKVKQKLFQAEEVKLVSS